MAEVPCDNGPVASSQRKPPSSNRTPSSRTRCSREPAKDEEFHGAEGHTRSLCRARLGLGALQRLLCAGEGRRGGRARERLRLPVRRTAAQPARAGRRSASRGARSGAAGQQRSVLRVAGADRGGGGASARVRGGGRAWSGRAGGGEGERNERLLPRSGRVTARIHFLHA